MRGKLLAGCVGFARRRITPACAGKTERNRVSSASVTDHPRVCGENFVTADAMPVAFGSPPRVRGKPDGETKALEKERITPACAGKTKCYSRNTMVGADHPRVCGENTMLLTLSKNSVGSPPRVRGKPLSSSATIPRARITPACAGKTPLMNSFSCAPPDHPRVCGENPS